MMPAANRNWRMAVRWILRALAWAVVLVIASGGGACQLLSAPSSANAQIEHTLQGLTQTDDSTPFGNMNAAIAQRRQIQIENARYRLMAADAAKLQKLAAELHAERVKANGAPMTGEQLRKLAEVEKLAHRIKETMRLSYNVNPQPTGPYYVPPSRY
ncbi:MAG: hypothetical protein P4K83_08770 [Terracidiphilus sp.]|nr:hypothetical protein [Terracidiphilus sp.]